MFIALHSFDDLATATNLDFMERTESEWLELFEDLCSQRKKWPVEDPVAEMQLLSLLRAVFESASGERNLPSDAFDMSLSAKDNIEKLSSLFDCGSEPEAAPFGSFDEERMRECLLRCALFKDDEQLNVALMKEHIRNRVPVGYPDVERLPSRLVHTLRNETVNSMRINM